MSGRKRVRNSKYFEDESESGKVVVKEEPVMTGAEETTEPIVQQPVVRPEPTSKAKAPVVKTPALKVPAKPIVRDETPEDKAADDDEQSQASEPIVMIPPSTASAANSSWSVPQYSYFEVRGDREKRAYVECFSEIIGRVKTNYHFRCKGCNESFVGQYLNILVHMAGTNNHVKARTRACRNPIPEVKAKILADFASYNEKEQYALSLLKMEPGQFHGMFKCIHEALV
jgi:hypothetical protein